MAIALLGVLVFKNSPTEAGHEPVGAAEVTLYFGAGQVISPWISGYIVDVTRSYSVPFMVSAAAGFAGAALSLILSEGADMATKR
ncbi:MAG: hypothetical protein QME41_07360 [Actinomycetota bacterium]|nr:hypothetical protein [Actinomycetota bacterium]